MALPLQVEPIGSAWSPRPVHLVVVEGGRPDAAVYRRRRLVAALLALVTVVALGFAVRAGAAVLGGVPASAPEPRPATDAPGTFGGQVLVPGGVYVVQPGDTLWALARALQPSGDITGLVHRLERLNGGPELDVGERLQLPG